MSHRKSRLTLAIHILLGGTVAGASTFAYSQPDTTTDDRQNITVIVVTSSAIDEGNDKIVAPYNVLTEEDIFQKGGTLGDLLNGLPGVHADSFGGGASRPVIRGQTSPRVRILSDSSSLFDASDISPDHAVTADPLQAQRIEVVRGPSTLLYGGGAIGGVVNVLDNKVPTVLPAAGFESTLTLRGNTAANEKAGAFNMTARATDNIAVNVQGSTRTADDYKAADWHDSRVGNTYSESDNVALGASWIGDKGYLGLAYSYRDDEYGIPGHSHEFESCHPHDSDLHCAGHEEEGGEEGHDHDHEHEELEAPFVNLENKRIDLRGELLAPFSGIHSIRIRASHTDYEHEEIEGTMVGTTFANAGYEGRIEVDHAPVLGWHGVFGTQFSSTRFSAAGEEAFIPRTDSDMHSLFVIEHYDFSDTLHAEAGLRHERLTHKPVNDVRGRPEFDGSAFSYSGALIWAFADEHTVALSFARAQRLPQAQELYARGIHLATNTYECGLVNHPLTCGGLINNATMAKETSNNIDLGISKDSGKLTYSVNLYRNQVDNYIYARTLDQHEDFRLIKYTQNDARISGVEAEIGYRFSDSVSASVFGDYVRAKFDEGGNLPRISPRRTGARLNLTHAGIDTELELYHVSTQNDIAAYETATAGYNMLNATIDFSPFGNLRYKMFVRGSNLLDEQVWSHSSFLANVIPMPGRNLSMGLSYTF